MAKKKLTTAKVKEAEKESVLLTSLPQNILKIGGHVEEDKNIYISQKVYKAIHNFTKDKLENESGGMLMGYTLEGAGKTNIIIDGFIEGKYSEATPTTLKFTHETWEYVHAEAEKKYPEYKIIGWIHTHPSFGIFLSEYDKFIQQNFFNGENQVAYVVDPIQKTEGFYFWINEKIEKCKGFYIYDKTGTPIVIESDPQGENKETAQLASSQKKTWKDYLLTGAAALTVILLFVTLSLNGKLSDLENDTNKIIAEQKAVETYISSLLNEIKGLKHTVNSISDSIDENYQAIEDGKYNCKIIFVRDDGSVIKETEYAFGDTIKFPESPSKPSDKVYDYVFEGWINESTLAIENSIYIAKYSSILREYTIKFVDVDGNIISERKYHYGDSVKVPTYTTTKESEDPNAFSYVLAWDKAVSTVEGDATYTAVFEKEYVEYTVRFLRDDGSLIEEKTYHYNDEISVSEPTKEKTETHTYKFTGWDKEFSLVTENTEYIASFEAILITDEDNTEENGGE